MTAVVGRISLPEPVLQHTPKSVTAALVRPKRAHPAHYKAGEKCFVDYSGSTVPVIDAGTGEVRQALVAVLGASNYTFWTQSLPDWLGSQARGLTFFGRLSCPHCPEDNLARLATTMTSIPATSNGLSTTRWPSCRNIGRAKAKADGGTVLVATLDPCPAGHHRCFSLAEVQGIRRVA